MGKALTPADFRPVTQEEMLRHFEAMKARKADANKLVSHPSAPYVFAPKRMWKRGTKGLK